MKIKIEHPANGHYASVHSNKTGINDVIDEICNLLIAYGYEKWEVANAIELKYTSNVS